MLKSLIKMRIRKKKLKMMKMMGIYVTYRTKYNVCSTIKVNFYNIEKNDISLQAELFHNV